MTTAIQPSGKQGALLIAGILMIATTLRVTFTGVAPARYHPTGLWFKHGANRPAHDAASAGLRLYLSPCRRRRPAPGHGAQPFIALLLICIGIGVRSLPSASLLFIGTAIVGCGIALGNVLLPGLIKRDFPGQVAN